MPLQEDVIFSATNVDLCLASSIIGIMCGDQLVSTFIIIHLRVTGRATFCSLWYIQIPDDGVVANGEYWLIRSDQGRHHLRTRYGLAEENKNKNNDKN